MLLSDIDDPINSNEEKSKGGPETAECKIDKHCTGRK